MKLSGGLIALAGLVLLIGGLILGFGTLHRDGVSCGSAFSPSSYDGNVHDLTSALTGQGSQSAADDCASATSDRKPIALAVTIPAGVMVVAGVCVLAAGARVERPA